MFSMRVPIDTLTTWQGEAKAAELSLSTWMRFRISASDDDPPQLPFRHPPRKRPQLHQASPADPVLVAKIAQLGNNLNQVARWANRYKSAADASQVLLALAAIEQHLNVILEM
jgi:hypothetical protein